MRSNDSIAQLACALAKAQIELVNPPKSLTAHFDGDWKRLSWPKLSLCAPFSWARRCAQDPR